MSLAGQKFIAEILNDALQQYRAKHTSAPNKKQNKVLEYFIIIYLGQNIKYKHFLQIGKEASVDNGGSVTVIIGSRDKLR